MFHCAVCIRDSSFSNLKTIGDQIVCSLACVGLLKSNSRDACDCCKHPVWKDNYYKIYNKCYCSEICKNKMLKKLNLSNDSLLVKHYKENIFSDNNKDKNIILKNSKQLRDEVLKFFKDFQFDTILDEDEDKKVSKKYNENRSSQVKDNKSFINNNLNDGIVINSYDKSGKKFEYTDKSKSNHRRVYTQINTSTSSDKKSKEENNKLNNKINLKANIKSNVNPINKSNLINKYNMPLNTINDYNTKRHIEINLDEQFTKDTPTNHVYTQFNTINTSNNTSYMKNYTLINRSNKRKTNQNQKNIFIQFNYSNKTPNRKGINYINLRKIETPNEKIKKECMFCGEKIGSATFFDRNNNRFCSDSCKEEFFKYYK